MTVVTGLDAVVEDGGRRLPEPRVGLIANPASVDRRLRHAVDCLQGCLGGRLQLLFGPEHGLRGTAQYMASVADAPYEQRERGIPVRALYGRDFDSLSPRAADMRALDVVVVDMQDVGARYYTFAATMGLAMRRAAECGTRVVVLDRPNPLGGLAVEGGGVLPALRNFCGLYPVPQRHGLTIGELARLYNDTFAIGCRLDVVPMRGWRRTMAFEQTGLPWVLPSPAMPSVDTAFVYPGACLLEATNLSEGRGTCRPFELVGAPWLDADAWAEALRELAIPGVLYRPTAFVPTFDKYQGQLCMGVQQHVVDRASFPPLRAGLALLWTARRLGQGAFAWRQGAYEFRDDVPAIDLLAGTQAVREALEADAPFDEVVAAVKGGCEAYDAGRLGSLLYA